MMDHETCLERLYECRAVIEAKDAEIEKLGALLDEALPLVEEAEFLETKTFSYGPGYPEPSPGEWGISVEYVDSRESSANAQYQHDIEQFHADNRDEDDGDGQFLTVANKIRRARPAPDNGD